jgi:hypothetical protein
MIEKEQEKSVEAEFRKLAEQILSLRAKCSRADEETDALSTHFHYLALMEGIKDKVKPVGDNFMVIDVDGLHEQLVHLASELTEFLEYVMYSTGKGDEKRFHNGLRDRGRVQVSLDYFHREPNAELCGLRYVMSGILTYIHTYMDSEICRTL